MVESERVAVGVLEERLPADTRVEDLAHELHAAGSQLASRVLEVVHVQRDRVVVRLEGHAERLRLHHRDREVAGLELTTGHVAPALREREAEHVAVELRGPLVVLRGHRDEIGARYELRLSRHRFLLLVAANRAAARHAYGPAPRTPRRPGSAPASAGSTACRRRGSPPPPG